jgi:uncharacterized protein DUF5829
MKKILVVGAMTLLLGSLSMGQVKMSSIPLNHFYIVLDSATYKAIEQDSFLRKEFAVTEQRTTKRTDMTYTGLYFYGTNTYFEFFNVANQPIGKLSDCGIAFGCDAAGTLEAIKTEWASKFLIREDPITRPLNDKQVPWFYMASPKNLSLNSGLKVWIMEYHPRFLSEWNSQIDAKDQGISRKQILQRYTDVLKQPPPRPYLKDVVALTVAVSEPTEKEMVDLCKLLGYTLNVAGTTTILKGPDIELRLIPETATVRGIQEITMRIDRKPEKQTEFRFGAKSVLKFHGNDLASWSF